MSETQCIWDSVMSGWREWPYLVQERLGDWDKQSTSSLAFSFLTRATRNDSLHHWTSGCDNGKFLGFGKAAKVHVECKASAGYCKQRKNGPWEAKGWPAKDHATTPMVQRCRRTIVNRCHKVEFQRRSQAIGYKTMLVDLILQDL